MHELEREPSHLAKSGDDSARQRGSADQPETQSRIDPIRRCVCSEKVRDGDREGGGAVGEREATRQGGGGAEWERGGRGRERRGAKGWSHVTRHVSVIRTGPPERVRLGYLLQAPWIASHRFSWTHLVLGQQQLMFIVSVTLDRVKCVGQILV